MIALSDSLLIAGLSVAATLGGTYATVKRLGRDVNRLGAKVSKVDRIQDVMITTIPTPAQREQIEFLLKVK